MKTKVPETELRPTDSREFFNRKMTRLAFIKHIALLSGAIVAGCSPLRVLFKAYAKKYDTDEQLIDRFLRAFVATVIPGAPLDEPNLVRIYSDDYYPFHTYRGFFASELAQRSLEMFDREEFDKLSVSERTAVIRSGLKGDEILTRLYRGAIFLAQASFYGGIYDDGKGCPTIDFHGSNSGFTPEEMCYPDNSRFMAHEATHNGNCA